MKLKYLSHTYNPKLPDAKHHIIPEFFETPDEAWKNYLEWLKDKVIGEPHGIEDYTAEQLKSMGYVGVYKKEGD